MTKSTTPASTIALRTHDINSFMSAPLIPLPNLSAKVSTRAHFFRIDAISEEKPSAYQRALANVFAAISPGANIDLIYLVQGTPSRVNFYFGVASENPNADLHEAKKHLKSAVEGHLPGVQLSEQNQSAIEQLVARSRRVGMVCGIPTPDDDSDKSDEDDFQGVERLVRAMQGAQDDWQLIVVARPVNRDVIEQFIERTMAVSSEISALAKVNVQHSSNTSNQEGRSISAGNTTGENESDSHALGRSDSQNEAKGTNSSSGGGSSSRGRNTTHSTNVGTNESKTYSTGTNTGTSTNYSSNRSDTSGKTMGISHEVANKFAERLLRELDETLLPRMERGRNKGLFQTSVYIASGNMSSWQLLEREVCATFQGSKTTLTPLRVVKFEDCPSAGALLRLAPSTQMASLDNTHALIHSLSQPQPQNPHLAYLYTTDELALVAGLPRHEVPGLARRKSVAFTVSLPPVEGDTLRLGQLVDHGRKHEGIHLELAITDLNKHTFVTGVTGSGKTTTCLALLIAAKLPFLVLEPAKTEYRVLHLLIPQLGRELLHYRLLADSHHALRINPFQLVHRNHRLASHICFLRNTLSAVFPMEASMPFIVEQAIIRAYEEKGWDIHENKNFSYDDPWQPGLAVWPTFSDMIRQLDIIIPEQKMGKEFEEKYRGSLVSRLASLTRGVLGAMLDVKYSTDLTDWLDVAVIVEMEEVRDAQAKSLLMALIIGRLAEVIKARHAEENGYRHLTLIEEAHRLLAQPEPGDGDSKKMGVETFADLIAEVRKYGEGLIVADQIPNKLIPDVIKNTHTKIVHRLFAFDDRKAIGEAMMLDEEQRNFLPNLATGEVIVYCGGWHGATRAQITPQAHTDDAPIPEETLFKCSINQVWRTRRSIYPHLAALPAFETADDTTAEQFVDFITQARAWLRRLLIINPRSETSASHLKRDPFIEWQFMHTQHTEWRRDPRWTSSDILAQAMCALIEDGNPRPKASEKNVLSFNKSDIESIAKALSRLLDKSMDLKKLKELAPNDGDFRAIFDRLKQYETL